MLNLFTAFLATWCISLFGATIEQMVVLAFLMPIVASMGGNAGMQTLAVTVRTIATNDLTQNNFSSNVFKEFSIGILNGIIFAAISALIVQIWFQDSIPFIDHSNINGTNNDHSWIIWYISSFYLKKNEYRPSDCFKCFCDNNYRCNWFCFFFRCWSIFFIKLQVIN